jgi:hypothetical protein
MNEYYDDEEFLEEREVSDDDDDDDDRSDDYSLEVDPPSVRSASLLRRSSPLPRLY